MPGGGGLGKQEGTVEFVRGGKGGKDEKDGVEPRVGIGGMRV